MSTLSRLSWPLVLGLGALALVRPLMSITGLMDIVGKPLGPWLITALISLAWVVIVLMARVRAPFLTLVLAGLSYGIFAILLSTILSPILTGRLQGPILHPIALVMVLLTNVLWGAAVGMVALLMRELVPHRDGDAR